MSTRKLILTALVCGLAILVAGAVQLVRISGGDRASDTALLSLGVAASVGGLDVRAESVSVDGALVTAVVHFDSAVEVAGFGDGWSLVGPRGVVARRTLPAGTEPAPCASLDATSGAVTCSLGFLLDQAAGDLRGYVLLFGRGSDRASWAAGL